MIQDQSHDHVPTPYVYIYARYTYRTFFDAPHSCRADGATGAKGENELRERDQDLAGTSREILSPIRRKYWHRNILCLISVNERVPVRRAPRISKKHTRSVRRPVAIERGR